MNEQILAAIVAAVIGFLTNIVIKKIEKQKEPEEKDRIAVETAEISLDILKQTLETVQKRNQDLEILLCECDNIRKQLNFLYKILFEILNDSSVILPEEKRKHLFYILERRGKND